MADIEILDLERHSTPEGVPFVIALVDDVEEGDVKLLVLFQEDKSSAALSMDKLQEEDLSTRAHPQRSSSLVSRVREMIGEVW